MHRQRSRRACDPCRDRKVKCSGSFPCDLCKGYGYECKFSAGVKRKVKRPRHEEASTAVSTPTPRTYPSPPEQTLRSTQTNATPVHELVGVRQSSMLVEVPNRKDPVLPSIGGFMPVISRFTTSYSAVAFPRELGVSIGLSDAPRLHPFAWNTGSRLERLPAIGKRVFDHIGMQDALRYINIYVREVHPVFGSFDPSRFTQTCLTAWNQGQMPMTLKHCHAMSSLWAFCSHLRNQIRQQNNML